MSSRGSDPGTGQNATTAWLVMVDLDPIPVPGTAEVFGRVVPARYVPTGNVSMGYVCDDGQTAEEAAALFLQGVQVDEHHHIGRVLVGRISEIQEVALREQLEERPAKVHAIDCDMGEDCTC